MVGYFSGIFAAKGDFMFSTRYPRQINGLATITLGLFVSAMLVGTAQAWENPKVAPPKGKPQRMSGGEGMPPLPLPATPLRRTERKREPSPPALIGKLGFLPGSFTVQNGRRKPAAGWPSTVIDIEPMMEWTNRQVGVKYRFVETTFQQFSFDPSEIPVLYLTGWTAMPDWGDPIREKMRRYLYDGGTLIIHSQCGRPEFNASVLAEMSKLFPDRPLVALDSDHPIYHCLNNIGQMKVRKDSEPMKAMPPYLQAVHIGVRAAVIFSPIDLSTGWDVANNPIEGGILYDMSDARRLAVNMVSYSLANTSYARTFAIEKQYCDQAEAPRDEFVLAQVVHSGDWDPTPHALPNLIRVMKQDTTLNVKFKRVPVNLADGKLSEHPVLFMTGLRDFVLSPLEVRNLRDYLQNGGKLIAESGAGWTAFDAAFRREMKKVLPEQDLKLLPGDHPLYSISYPVGQVGFSPIVSRDLPDLKSPVIESLQVDGQEAVLYSRFSLSRGWELFADPYSKSYKDTDALRLGVNLFTYAMTH